METTAPSDLTHTLTNRQFAVLVFWAKEYSKEQIADFFHLSEGWANKEIRIIYKLLGVCTRHGAVDKAWLLGIFTKENRQQHEG
jgi:DNA-binding CsgD family transcriptional regulator